MTSKLPNSIKNFFPPDYMFDGAYIEAVLQKDSIAALADAEIKNPDLDRVRTESRAHKYPGRAIPPLNIDALMLLKKGLYYYHEQYGNKWPMSGYEVNISIHPEQRCGSVFFFPKVENFIQGIPFEISVGGVRKNGIAVTYYLSLVDFSLIEKIISR